MYSYLQSIPTPWNTVKSPGGNAAIGVGRGVYLIETRELELPTVCHAWQWGQPQDTDYPLEQLVDQELVCHRLCPKYRCPSVCCVLHCHCPAVKYWKMVSDGCYIKRAEVQWGTMTILVEWSFGVEYNHSSLDQSESDDGQVIHIHKSHHQCVQTTDGKGKMQVRGVRVNCSAKKKKIWHLCFLSVPMQNPKK